MQSVNRFEAHNHALRTLVATAYYLNPQAISVAHHVHPVLRPR